MSGTDNNDGWVPEEVSRYLCGFPDRPPNHFRRMRQRKAERRDGIMDVLERIDPREECLNQAIWYLEHAAINQDQEDAWLRDELDSLKPEPMYIAYVSRWSAVGRVPVSFDEFFDQMKLSGRIPPAWISEEEE